MKKLIIAILLVLGSFSLASAETIRISVGANGNIGMLAADGEEHSYVARATLKNKVEKRSEELLFGAASLFGEIHAPFGFRVGVSFVPYTIESNTTSSKYTSFQTCPATGTNNSCNGLNGASNNSNGQGTGEADITQKVQVDINDMTTMYVAYHHTINENQSVFIKAGLIQADLVTNEVLQTNSVYGNTTLDGQTASIGYEHNLPNGFFVRGAADYTAFDDISISSTGTNANANKVLIRNMAGPSGTFSIGKTF